MNPPEPSDRLEPYAAFRYPQFCLFLCGNFLALIGSQMQSTAVGWEMYQRTGEYLDLGLVGLAQVIPVVLLTLPAGNVVDRFDRRYVIIFALSFIVLTSIALAVISMTQAPTYWVYVCLALVGVARAFQQPAKSAILPTLVPKERFTNAVTWATSAFQLATIVGPALGGVVIWLSGGAICVYLLDAVLAGIFLVALFCLPPRPAHATGEPLGLSSLAAGASYVWNNKLIFAAITLDMFAVLLGGATSLLPIYAKDILATPGAVDSATDANLLGWLRAAPGIGALIMSFVLAHLPPFRRAGRTLLFAIAGFGIATIVFGFSRNFWVAWTALLLTGALDMVSVIIRHTLVQIGTPDSMRGRVSAVNGMFISVSNELGGFESALVARIFRSTDPTFGPTVSVVSGGIGTLGVVILSSFIFPSLMRLGSLADGHRPRPENGSSETEDTE